MANDACTFDLHLDEKSVAIAICSDGDDFQAVSGSFAFGPELVASPAEECDVAAGQSALEGCFVHKPEHQHLRGAVVLHDGWHQPLHLFEIDLLVHIPPQKRKNPLMLSRQRAS